MSVIKKQNNKNKTQCHKHQVHHNNNPIKVSTPSQCIYRLTQPSVLIIFRKLSGGSPASHLTL